MPRNLKPAIAITMGDPTGVGPEVIVKAIASGLLDAHCKPLVLGRPAILKLAAHASAISIDVFEVESVDEWQSKSERPNLRGTPALWCLSTGKADADEATDPIR